MTPPTGSASLSELAIRRPVFTWMVMAALVVLGIFAFRRLPIDQFPKVDFPVVTVLTTYRGASPQTVERDVSRLLERAFQPIEGVRRVTSASVEGASQVVVEFELGRSIDEGAADIRTKLDAVRRDLPRDIEPPQVQKVDPASQPIVSLAMTGDGVPLSELTRLADEEVRRAFESVSGVGEVRVIGGLAREIRVQLRPSAMQALGVDAAAVMAAIDAQNVEAPAGRVRTAERVTPLRVTGRVLEPRQFADLVVARRGPGSAPIRVGDVATVLDTTEEARSIALLHQGASTEMPRQAISIDILKVSGANTVAVSDAVGEAMRRLRTQLPSRVELQLIRDNAITIRQSVEDVIAELVLGGVLTVVIVFLFLGDPKATAITALTLPVSVVSTFVLMGALGFTLNIMTLLALSICIGILIDDAIVVIESIARYRQRGASSREAAAIGTRSIALAVLATTFTIVAVFVPVAFMKGLIGRFFYEFGVTVSWAVLVSLFVSFTLTPMLAAHWGLDVHSETGQGRGVLGRVARGVDRAMSWLVARYRTSIAWALGHRSATMLIAGASFVAALALAPVVGGGFAPDVDAGELLVQFRAEEGASLEFTRARATVLSTAIRRVPGVAFTYVTVGSGPAASVREGEVFVRLVPRARRTRTQLEMTEDIRARLSGISGLEVSILQPGGPAGATAPLSVQVRGPDPATLMTLVRQVEQVMRATPGVVDVRNSMGGLQPDYRVIPRRGTTTRLDVSPEALISTVRPLFAGTVASRWVDEGGEERDVVVSLGDSDRSRPTQVRDLPIPLPGNGNSPVQLVPLRDLAEVVSGLTPARIERFDLERAVTLSANISLSTTLSDASSALEDAIRQLKLPTGYSISLGGDTEQLKETVGYLLEAITLAVILIFLILASQFESVRQPVAIMLALPLSLIGVMLALLATRTTLNIMSMIGVIMLLGLVTKNAILLVDQANTRRAAGATLDTAIVEAGAERLRPILMTTVAMIAGMLPIALSLGEGGEFRAPMARAVIGGLITSTLLTLLVVPVGYRVVVAGRRRSESDGTRASAVLAGLSHGRAETP